MASQWVLLKICKSLDTSPDQINQKAYCKRLHELILEYSVAEKLPKEESTLLCFSSLSTVYISSED